MLSLIVGKHRFARSLSLSVMPALTMWVLLPFNASFAQVTHLPATHASAPNPATSDGAALQTLGKDLGNVVTSWRKSHGDVIQRESRAWKEEGRKRADALSDAVTSRLHTDGGKLKGQVKILKARASNLSKTEKEKLEAFKKSQRAHLQAWRAAHPQDSRNLDEIVTKTRKRVSDALR